MMKPHRILIPFLSILAAAPVGCDDPELLVDEELLLSDEPDVVDAALEAAADQLAADGSEWEPRANFSATNFSATNNLRGLCGFAVSTALTLEVWVRPTANPATDAVIMQQDNQFQMYMSPTGKLSVGIAADGVARQDTGYTIPLNKWTHLAVSYNSGTDTAVVLANGVAVKTYTGLWKSSVAVAGSGWYVGSHYVGSYPFKGSIDDIRVWSVARTAAQIQGAMFSSAPSGTGLVANYKFDGTGSGTVAGSCALTVVGVPFSSAKAPHIAGTVKYNTTTKRAYMASTTTAAWATARTSCAGNTGWTLVTINDATEDTYIDGTVLGGTNTSRYWIGYNDSDNNGTYVWANGEGATYKDGTPALTKGQCMADNTLVGSVYDTWAPRSCAEANRFICEYRFL